MPGGIDSDDVLYGDLLRSRANIYAHCPDLKQALEGLHPLTHLLVLLDRSGSAAYDSSVTQQQYQVLTELSELMEHEGLADQRLSAFGFSANETFAVKTVISPPLYYDSFVSRGGGEGTSISRTLDFALDHLIYDDHGAVLLVSDGIDGSPAEAAEKIRMLREARKPFGLLLQDHSYTDAEHAFAADIASETYADAPTFTISPLADTSRNVRLGIGHVIEQLGRDQD